jgi:FMN phosphatase YigB (HAD superfamily)
MSLKKCIFLLDFDDTLIDTNKLKRKIEADLNVQFKNLITPQLFWKSYNEITKKYKYNNVPKLAELISKKCGLKRTTEIGNLFYNAKFKSCLHPSITELIKSLKRLGDVKIYSLGHPQYQLIKIRKSGVEKMVGKKNVIIVQDKKKGFREILHESSKKYERITIIDDRSDILESATLISPKITTVWVKQGEYEGMLPIRKNSITYKVNSLSEAILFLESFIEILPQKKLNRQISVIRGIYGNYIDQLITYTKRDRLINKFTNDKERFISKKSFNSWVKRKKTIYTLLDSNQKMLGIIWFAKEKFRECGYTFAIRTYTPVRGKGLAIKFKT